jgi:RNase P/RNase MRP subunit p29
MPDPERRRPPELWPRLHHKVITVRISGAPSVSGELVFYTTYEIVVKMVSGREVAVPKHSILSVDLPDGWRRPRPFETDGGMPC